MYILFFSHHFFIVVYNAAIAAIRNKPFWHTWYKLTDISGLNAATHVESTVICGDWVCRSVQSTSTSNTPRALRRWRWSLVASSWTFRWRRRQSHDDVLPVTWSPRPSLRCSTGSRGRRRRWRRSVRELQHRWDDVTNCNCHFYCDVSNRNVLQHRKPTQPFILSGSINE